MHDNDRRLVAKAVFPYVANSDILDELSFKKYENLEVTEKVPRWWNAKNNNGETGIVHSPYFIMAEEAMQPLPLTLPPSYRPTVRSVVDREDPSNSTTTVAVEPSNQFYLLADLHTAQAVWNASDEDSRIVLGVSSDIEEPG